MKKNLFQIPLILIFLYFQFSQSFGQNKTEKPDRPVDVSVPNRFPLFIKTKDLKPSEYQTYSGWALRLTAGPYFPKGAFARTTQRTFSTGFMLGFSYLLKDKKPFSAGLDFGIILTGSSGQRFTLGVPITSGTTTIDNIQLPLEATFSTQIYPFLLHLEGWLPTKGIQPYGGLYAGCNTFSTITKIYDRSFTQIFSNGNTSRVILTDINSFAIAWAAGLGGGLRINMGGITDLDLGVNYLFGGPVKYYDGGDVGQWKIEYKGNPSEFGGRELNSNDLSVQLNRKSSTTNMLQFLLRLHVKI